MVRHKLAALLGTAALLTSAGTALGGAASASAATGTPASPRATAAVATPGTTGAADHVSLTSDVQDTVTVTNPGDQATATGTPVSLQIQATSSGGYPLTYTATDLPRGLSINRTSGLITGTPSFPNSYPVTVTATDATGVSGHVSFTWNVIEDGVTVTNPGPEKSATGTPVSLQIQATSTDGKPLTYSATGLPPGLSIGSSSGLITGEPSTLGSYGVTVTATDSIGASGKASFTWKVTDKITITNPGTQATDLGSPVSLQIHATSSDGRPLTYALYGVSRGLSINSASGLITGKPADPGSYSTIVTVTDTTGAFSEVFFTWNITGAANGTITGYGSKCVDGYLSGTANGNKIDISSCNGTAAQQWTLTSSGELVNAVSGKCLNDAGYGGQGTRQILWTCIDSPNEIWTYNSFGRYVLKANGLCLNDPGYSRANGTQLIIWPCGNYSNESWSLPGGVPPALTGAIKGYAGRCVDDYLSGTANGNKIDISSCNGTFAQQWIFTDSGELVNSVSGLCLNDAGYGGQGTRQIQWACTGSSNEIWSHSSEGRYVLKANGLCLNDPGYSRTNGTQLIIWACGNYANELWSLPAGTAPSTLTGAIKGYASRCVDGSGTANSSKVDISTCNGTAAQRWALTSSGELRNAASGKCLNDAGYGGQGTKLILWTCGSSYSNEVWRYDSAGRYVLKANGLCLNDPRYSTANGTQLIIWACGPYNNEVWSLPS